MTKTTIASVINSTAIAGISLGTKNLVSIVLPVYNQAHFIAESIDSVLAQSYPDFELIVVNDGSTDNVEQVLAQYDDPRITVIHQQNQKLPRALNSGFVHARGEYYTWTSADNIMLPHQIERLVVYLIEHPDVAMVYTDYQAIDDAGHPLNDPTFRPHNQDPLDRSIIRLPDEVTEANFHDSGDNFIGASFMYRRDVAWFIGDYAADTFGGEDYDYWLRISNFFGIGHLPEVLYKYRVHDNTLNAKASELGIFPRIRKVLRRDAELRRCRQKHWQPAAVVDLAAVKAQLRREGVLVYDYSQGSRWWSGRSLLLRRPFRVCLIDVPVEELAEQELRQADLIVTSDLTCFNRFTPLFRSQIFHFDGASQPDLLLLLARCRHFLWRK